MANGIAEHFMREWDLMWTNPSPTESFSPKTISLDLSGYMFIRIQFRLGTAASRSVYVDAVIGEEDYSAEMFNSPLISTSTGAMYGCARAFSSTSNGVTFSTAYKKPTNATTARTADNDYVLPVRIWAR